MEQEITNFARFYAILKRMPGIADQESAKRELVLIGTGGRTDSLRTMTQKEYDAMCDLLSRRLPICRSTHAEQRRRRRSVCLRLLQKIGVDTTSWAAVNSYCCSPRIAGKAFAQLGADELERLSIKLRMILKKKQGNQ